MQNSSRSDVLSGPSRLLIVISTLYTAAQGLSSIFVNVYIWRVDHSFVALGLFNLLLFMVMPLAFFFSGLVAWRIGELWIVRTGVVVLAVFFSVMLILGETSARHVLWLGALFGLGQGFYWYGLNVLTFDFTAPENRGQFNGLSGLFNSLAGTVCPLFAGYLIVHARGWSGYHLVFSLSLALLGILFWLSLRIALKRRSSPTKLAEGFRLRAHKDWRRLWIALIVFGLREGVFTFFTGLLVYFVTKSEEGLGLYGLWTGLLSLGTFYVAGRLSRNARFKIWSMRLAAVFVGLVCLLLLWEVTRRTMIVFGTVTALCLPFLLVPFHALTMDEIGESRRSARFRSEYLISREIALGIGRTVSVLIFVFLAANVQTSGPLLGLTVVFGFSHTFVVILIAKVRQEKIVKAGRMSLRPLTHVGRLNLRRLMIKRQ